MDPRATERVQATGTLPLSGQDVGVRPRARAPGRGVPRGPEARDGLTEPGQVPRLRGVRPPGRGARSTQEWTRIGRSLAADVRFDDATVSRRHALIVCQAEGVRVLDDRSLNGVYVNGERVEWSPLTDGDEILVGRHAIWFLDTTASRRRGRRRRRRRPSSAGSPRAAVAIVRAPWPRRSPSCR